MNLTTQYNGGKEINTFCTLTMGRQLGKLRDPIMEMVEFGNIEKGELFGRAQYNGHTLHRFQTPLVMCLFLWKSTNWKMLPFAPKNLKSNGSNCLNFFPNWWSNFTNTILLYKLAIVLFLFKKSTYFHSHPLGGKIACWLATVWASGASLCIQYRE